MWNYDDVRDYAIAMDELKKDVSECEGQIMRIQQQQEALQAKASVFPRIGQLKTNVMPTLTQAWAVINQFNEKFFEWWKTPFPKLMVEEMEESHLDWIRKLNYV